MAHAKDLTGQKFGLLTAMRRSDVKDKREYKWVYLCQCGNTCVMRPSYVSWYAKKGQTPSCGCITEAMRKANSTTHGHSRNNEPIYMAWSSMRQRCNNPSHKAYASYGGRGIKVCKRWDKFENFFSDMSPTWKKGLSLDRIDNNKGYSPDNCRWVTMSVQNRNKRNNRLIDGVPVSMFAEQHGLKAVTVLRRIKDGTPHEYIGSPIGVFDRRRKQHAIT